MAQLFQSEVYGVQPVLRVLKQLEPELYKEIEQQLKTSAEPLRRYVADGFPAKPMTNWTLYGRTKRGRKMADEAGASFPRYQKSKVDKGLQVRVGGRRRNVGGQGVHPILRLIQKDAGAQIYDLAGDALSQRGEQFIKNVNRTGKPSRTMWKRATQKFPAVQDDIEKIIRSVEARFTAEVARQTHISDAQSKKASKQLRNSLGQFGS